MYERAPSSQDTRPVRRLTRFASTPGAPADPGARSGVAVARDERVTDSRGLLFTHAPGA
jgi:hypothetical protein